MPSPFVTCNTITVCSQIISVHPALISSSWININSILCVFLVFLSPIKSDSYHHFCQLQTGGYTLDIVMIAKCFGEFRLGAPKLHSFHYKNNKFTSNLSYRHNKILDISCIFFLYLIGLWLINTFYWMQNIACYILKKTKQKLQTS